MRLTIQKFDNFDRPWLLKREDGEYEQHCHFYKKKDAKRVKHLIEIWKYPKKKNDREAMLRILTEEEFKSLNKKERYYRVPVKCYYSKRGRY